MARGSTNAALGGRSRAGAATEFVDPVVAARFKIPSETKGFIGRPRLLERLDHGAGGPLTLVSAPAGTGKTATVSSWARHGRAPGPVAWVTLEAADAIPAAFWSSFAQGLTQIGIGEPLAAQGAPHEKQERNVASMSSTFAEGHDPVVVVLDCESPLSAGVAAELDGLLSRANGQLRLVVVTRVDPVLRLHRYRLAGTMAEIRMADLAFTMAEARSLLISGGVDLSASGMEAIHARTRGWVAGLRFAAMSLTGRRDPDNAALEFSGDTGNVAEYLLAEVLDAQPAGARTLLLESSIVDVLRPGLSEALAGPHAQRALAFLARGNAFLEELADLPGCYRYQPLFRQLLRAQLAYEKPQRVPELHRVAGAWFADDGLLEDAVRHATAAGDWAGAARYVIDDLAIGQLLREAGSNGLAGALEQIPDDVLDVPSALIRAARAMATFDLETCSDHLLRVRAQLAGARPSHGSAAEVTLQILTLIHSRATADIDGGMVAAEEAERLLHRSSSERLARRPELALLISSGKGSILLATGRLDEAAEAFSAGVHGSEQPGCEGALIDCLGHLALLAAMRGQLREAADLAARSTSVRKESGIDPACCSNAAHVALAWVSVEHYDLPAARRHAARASESVGTDPLPRLMLALVDARLRRARRDVDGARARIVSARDESPSLPAWMQDQLLLEEAELDVVVGESALAIATMEGLDEPASSRIAVLRARAALATGSPVALPATTLRNGSAPLPSRVDGWLLEAERQLDSGEQRRAVQALDHSLRLAAAERLRRPFREAPPALRRLLRTNSQMAARHSWLGAGIVDGAYLVPGPRRRPEPHLTGDDGLTGQSLLEPLTDKELEVLGHLAELLTTGEIAGVMFVSVNTVRTHVRNILRKLAAPRRNEAVRRARDLGIIPSWSPRP